MEQMRAQVKERPTAARALSSLGAVVGLSRSTIRRQLRSEPKTTTPTKDAERRVEIQKVALDVRYEGFEIPPRFVVGYGLDYRQKYRNLPYVAVMREDPPHSG